jgi:hypothetical protein
MYFAPVFDYRWFASLSGREKGLRASCTNARSGACYIASHDRAKLNGAADCDRGTQGLGYCKLELNDSGLYEPTSGAHSR